ncbi:MAG: PHP domain-containing protein [Phycisphaerae bacterium]|nr:PHP domain-containing protein [Phycisphaerae bacterium]
MEHPRRLIDLHTHSTASDGTVSPSDLIDLADRRKLAAVAITDHDTTTGLPAAVARAERYPQLHLIPGIEISAMFSENPGGIMHILGLGVDPDSPSLKKLCRHLRQQREQRNPRIIAKLQSLGIDIEMDDVLQQVPGSQNPDERIVGRVHMAKVLVNKGFAKSTQEAFDRYLGGDAPAFVDKERLTPREAITGIVDSGGAAVIAHPAQLRCCNSAQLRRLLKELIAVGLTGLECYHSQHTPEQTRLYLDFARELNLLVTGGSDYHGLGKPDTPLGVPRVPLSVIRDDWAQKWFGDRA